MNTAIVAALIRHLLTTLGGGVAMKYGVDGDTLNAIAGGAAALAGVAWSVAEKRRRPP